MAGDLQALLLLDLMLLVDDFDNNESDAAHYAGRHQDEHSSHVLEAEGGRRLLVSVTSVLLVLQDPPIVQLLHVATFMELQDG